MGGTLLEQASVAEALRPPMDIQGYPISNVSLLFLKRLELVFPTPIFVRPPENRLDLILHKHVPVTRSAPEDILGPAENFAMSIPRRLRTLS